MLHATRQIARDQGRGRGGPWSRAAPQFYTQLTLTRRLTTIESCSMFMLEDIENFFRFSSLAASIAALLWGGDGSLLAPRARRVRAALSAHAAGDAADHARRSAAAGNGGRRGQHARLGKRVCDSLRKLLALLGRERPRRVAHFRSQAKGQKRKEKTLTNF